MRTGKPRRLAAYDFQARPAPLTSTELAAPWRPSMGTCIELFGPVRCMFEGNFPVEKMGVGWATLWNALKRIAAGASSEEKRSLFSGTTRHV
jgi:L-fuconolactonase